jgi:hypothetical protein
MNPNLYGTGISRIEHFDLTTEQARPHRTLQASDLTTGSFTTLNPIDYCKVSGVLYLLGYEITTVRPAIAKWSASTLKFEGWQSFNASYAITKNIHSYKGAMYGLVSGTKIWKMTTGGSLNAAFADLVYTQTANTAKWITHSKDALAYIPIDNKVFSFDGTTATVVFTHPNANFLITDISEYGDNIMIAGYDSTTGESSVIEWDRQSTVATAVAKYELGEDRPFYAGTLGGTYFVVCRRAASSNELNLETTKMVVRYLYGSSLQVKNEFDIGYSGGSNFHEGSKTIADNRLYFGAFVKMSGDTANHFVVFGLDQLGNLSIAQNVGINDAGSNSFLYGIMKEAGLFFIAAQADGAWNTIATATATYTTTSVIETPKYSHPDMSKNLDLKRVNLQWEAMPSGGQVLLKTRANEETAWTTIATFNTANSLKGGITKQGCTTVPSIAKERQFRIESTGGVVITGFQVQFESVDNEA